MILLVLGEKMKNTQGLQGLVISVAICLLGCGGSSDNTSTDTVVEVPITPTPTTQPTADLVSIFGPANFTRIASGENGLIASLDSGDRFGRDHDVIGDVNGDGVIDLIVGARSDDDGAVDAGAAYIIFMNADGSVASNQKISMLEGNFADILEAGSFFGYGVAGIGDYDGDNVPDVAISAPNSSFPAIYILHLNTDGTVKSMVKNNNIVAQGLSAIGDIDLDGKVDLVAANPNAAGGGVVQLLFFDTESILKYNDIVVIGENQGGFGEGIAAGDSFGGRESALLGDLDRNGTQELAIGAFESDGGLGAIWVVSLDNETYNVVDKRKIAPGLAGFDETIPIETNNNGTEGGHFGHALVATGDLNGDGVPDLITGANQHNSGVAYVIYLNPDKSVKTYTRISETEGGFDLPIDSETRFSRSMSFSGNDYASGRITVNFGGGVSVGGSGKVYALTFDSCNYTKQGENNFWEDGNTLFSNWDHGSQAVTGALTFEQCVVKSFENSGTSITFKASDGRCIVKDSTAILAVSEEGSEAYVRSCT
jgi:hypothetical protein